MVDAVVYIWAIHEPILVIISFADSSNEQIEGLINFRESIQRLESV